MEMNTNNLGFMASYVEKDIHKAINIRGRFEDYLRNFTDIDEPNSIKTAKSFAKEFKEFEDTNFSLVPMNYLYGNMSKAYLHSKDAYADHIRTASRLTSGHSAEVDSYTLPIYIRTI